jgi:hypothetical protein
MITVEHILNEQTQCPAWVFTHHESGETKVLDGRAGAMLSLMLSTLNYELRPDFRPLDAFTEESLARGRAWAEQQVTP